MTVEEQIWAAVVVFFLLIYLAGCLTLAVLVVRRIGGW